MASDNNGGQAIEMTVGTDCTVEEIWMCGKCQNVTFKLHSDHKLRCSACGTLQAGYLLDDPLVDVSNDDDDGFGSR